MNGNVDTFLIKRFDRGVATMTSPAWSRASDSWSRGLLGGGLGFPSPDHNRLLHEPVFALLSAARLPPALFSKLFILQHGTKLTFSNFL